MIKEKLSLYIPAIEEHLKRVVKANIPSGNAEIEHMLAYHLGWEGEGAGYEAQGKRIRSVLSLLAAESTGGLWQNALPVAASVELIHNFSLVHDDIQDQSPLRRGRPTVWVKWGMPQAINVGDVLFTLAQIPLLDLPLEYAVRINRLLQKTCLQLTEGQYLDMAFEKKNDLPLDAYWKMIGGKTAALLAFAVQAGSLIGGCDEAHALAYYNFGYNLGLAFQVQDDLLGIWGNASMIGKSTESDLVTGKKTLPVVYALTQSGQFAHRWHADPIQPMDVPFLADLLEQEGARDFAQAHADRLTQIALSNLQQAEPGGSAGEALRELAYQLLDRTS